MVNTIKKMNRKGDQVRLGIRLTRVVQEAIFYCGQD